MSRWRSEREREKRKIEGSKEAETKETVELQVKVKGVVIRDAPDIKWDGYLAIAV